VNTFIVESDKGIIHKAVDKISCKKPVGFICDNRTLNQITLEREKMSNEQKEPGSKKASTLSMGMWIAVGVAIGAGMGVALDNIALGLAIGLAIGVATGAAQNQKNKNK